MIAITGATGQLGRLVISSLLQKVPAAQLVATVRNPDKAKDLAELGVQVRQADYGQPETWAEALRGVEKLLLISSSEIGQRAAQHRNVIEAAGRAGIKFLAYTSVLHADTSVLGLAEEHRQTEAMIRAADIPFALLRNGWYTENYAAGVPAVLAHGALFGCAGVGRISAAARADYAEAAARVLTADDQAGKVYELAGDSAFNLAELAAEIGRVAGREIGYVNQSEAEYKSLLLGAGLPEPVAELLANSESGAAKRALFDDSGQLSRLIGRPTIPWQSSIARAVTSV